MYYIIRSIPVDQSHRIVGIMKKKKQKAELSGQFIVNPYPELRPFLFVSGPPPSELKEGPWIKAVFLWVPRPFGRYNLFRIMALELGKIDLWEFSKPNPYTLDSKPTIIEWRKSKGTLPMPPPPREVRPYWGIINHHHPREEGRLLRPAIFGGKVAFGWYP